MLMPALFLFTIDIFHLLMRLMPCADDIYYAMR